MLHIAQKIRALLPLVAAFVAMLIASPAFAQTTGGLNVHVVDDDMGLDVPGAMLVLSGENQIGGAQTLTADAEGHAQFTALYPGAYRLEVTKAGFVGVTVDNIRINVGTPRQLEVEISAGEGEVIEVVATEKAVDTSDTSRKTILTKDFLNKVPAGRSYQSALQTVGGVSGGSNPNMAGGASNENTYMLDGANITDPVTGTFSANFNFDAIQQIEVLLGGYMPEYGVSAGGVVNIVTDSGSNNLKFLANVYYINGNFRPYKDARLGSDGVQLIPSGFGTDYQQLSVGSYVSGPLIRDKAWFVISYQSAQSWNRLAGTPQTQLFNGNYVLAKLTVQPTNEHRISVNFQTNPTTIDNFVQGTPYVKAEAQGRQAQGGFINQMRWQWFLSPDVNVDTQLLLQKIYIEQNAVACTHEDLDWHRCRPGELEGNIDWETPGRVGLSGAYDSVNWGSWYFDDRFRYSASSKLSILSLKDPLNGTHDLKLGVDATQLVWDQSSGMAGNVLYVDLNEVSFNPQTLKNYYWIEYSGPVTFRTTASDFSLFAQDSWKPVSNLTLNYGSRFDSFVYRDDVGNPVLSGSLFGPRLFGAWDPFKDQKTKIATGYGRFNDTGRLGTASFTSRGTQGNKLYFGSFGETDAGQGFLNSSELFLQGTPATNLNTRADNIRTPRVDEVLLTLEREVIKDFALLSTMSGKFTRSGLEPDELNLIYDDDGSTIIGSRYANVLNPYLRLRSPALAKRDYYQWDLGFRKVQARRWYMDGKYVLIRSVGSSPNALSGSFAIDPQTRYNYGLMTTSSSQIKANGFWEIPTDPWKQTLGFAFRWEQGFPYQRLYWAESQLGAGGGAYGMRIEPRGTYLRFGSYWDLALRFQQDIDLRKGKLIIDLQVMNVTNNRAPQSLFLFQLNANGRYVIGGRQSPLEFQTGLRYEF
jgi:hypothetical protein